MKHSDITYKTHKPSLIEIAEYVDSKFYESSFNNSCLLSFYNDLLCKKENIENHIFVLALKQGVPVGIAVVKELPPTEYPAGIYDTKRGKTTLTKSIDKTFFCAGWVMLYVRTDCRKQGVAANLLYLAEDTYTQKIKPILLPHQLPMWVAEAAANSISKKHGLYCFNLQHHKPYGNLNQDLRSESWRYINQVIGDFPERKFLDDEHLNYTLLPEAQKATKTNKP